MTRLPRAPRPPALATAAVTLVVTAAFALLTLMSAAVPAAASTSSATVGSGPAYVRLAHLSPDTPAVDVYLSSVSDPARSFTVTDVSYGAVSPYRAVDPGSYVVSMRAAGKPATSPPVISTAVQAHPGGAYTIAGTGMNAALGLSVLTDRLDMPAPGRATVRVINASVSTPVVDLGPAGGAPWARGVRFATTTDYADVALGTWNVQVTSGGRTTATLPVHLDVNSVYTVLLIDKDGGLAVQLHRDSSGSGVVPVGSVETGMGGAAPNPAAVPDAVLAAALGVALTGGLLSRRFVTGRAGAR